MILAILQARMSSSRLPGKVLKPLLGRPMMGRQIDRLRCCRRIDRLIVATSTEAGDDPVAAFCAAEDVPCFRGSLADVLSRYAAAAEAFGPAEHVVRLTADCPLTDWRVVDECIALHLASHADYTANGVERTYPKGLDVEVMTASTLRRANSEATAPAEREHVTMFIYNHPELFRISHLKQSRELGAKRWTVDTPADFAFAEAVYGELLSVRPDFNQDDILALVERRPDIERLNADVT